MLLTRPTTIVAGTKERPRSDSKTSMRMYDTFGLTVPHTNQGPMTEQRNKRDEGILHLLGIHQLRIV